MRGTQNEELTDCWLLCKQYILAAEKQRKSFHLHSIEPCGGHFDEKFRLHKE
jgi:hypothetical protein